MSEYNKPLVVQPRIQEFSAQLLWVPAHHTLFIFPPKCAQTSLRKWIGSDGVTTPVHFRDVPADATVVMSVRNPYERLVSAWANKYDHMDFNHFVMCCCRHTNMALDIHVQDQVFLLNQIGRRWPDYTIRVDDNLVPDILDLSRHISLPRRMPGHDNKSVHKSALSIINEHGRDLYALIRIRYDADFELWERANAEET